MGDEQHVLVTQHASLSQEDSSHNPSLDQEDKFPQPGQSMAWVLDPSGSCTSKSGL